VKLRVQVDYVNTLFNNGMQWTVACHVNKLKLMFF